MKHEIMDKNLIIVVRSAKARKSGGGGGGRVHSNLVKVEKSYFKRCGRR